MSCSSTFVVFTDCELPEELVSLTRLLLQSDAEWQKTQAKSKLPKPTVDADVLAIAVEVLQNRLAEYPTTIEVSKYGDHTRVACSNMNLTQEDETLLTDTTLGTNKRNAVVVRLGEKRVLAGTLAATRAQLERLQATAASNGGSKRKRAENGQTKGKGDKKARR